MCSCCVVFFRNKFKKCRGVMSTQLAGYHGASREKTLTWVVCAADNPGSFSWRALLLKAGGVAGGSAEAPAFPMGLWAIAV